MRSEYQFNILSKPSHQQENNYVRWSGLRSWTVCLVGGDRGSYTKTTTTTTTTAQTWHLAAIAQRKLLIPNRAADVRKNKSQETERSGQAEIVVLIAECSSKMLKSPTFGAPEATPNTKVTKGSDETSFSCDKLRAAQDCVDNVEEKTITVEAAS